ncbi:MAG: hypothetical protein LBL79_02490 [Prevotella sp.]|jgi:hypothetical protein|nr:hypothetical protein [Prevotella sp.]
MSDFLMGSICVSDIPKELFKKADNGKIYLNIAVAERQSVSQYGDTHNVIASKSKEQRAEGEKPLYIGNLKRWNETPRNPAPEEINNLPAADTDDLPF